MLGTQQEIKEERRWSNETILTGGREKIVFFGVVK